MKRYCFALDLKDDEKLIAEYESWHRAENGWPEIKKSIVDAHVTNMEIYRTGNRLMMIMEVDDFFSLTDKAMMDIDNPKVREWEQLMDKFQQPLPWAKDGEKWVLMHQIYHLNANEIEKKVPKI